jgi:carbonic anhydrase
MDPRVDPAHILGLALGDAVVVRNAGGRATDAALADLAYVSYLLETKTPDGPFLEIAIIHHTECGSGFLADDDFRRGFASRVGVDEQALADVPVLDPSTTVKADVERVIASGLVSSAIMVSGHVYDVATGRVTTVVG